MIASLEIDSRAQQFERSGDLEQALELYRQALLQEPGEANLWARLGGVCCALGHTDEALTALSPGRATPA